MVRVLYADSLVVVVELNGGDVAIVDMVLVMETKDNCDDDDDGCDASILAFIFQYIFLFCILFLFFRI